jgi:hypothetical protein
MSKSNTRVLGFALAVASAAFIFAGPASAQTGAYTDPSQNVRSSLEREHMVLSHPYAVRQPSAADRAARTAAPFYASTDPVFVGKDLSIRSQR